MRWLPAVAWAALIFVLSSLPRLPEVPVQLPELDKLLHALAFAVLALLCAHGLGWPRGRRLLWAAALASGYGVLDELHQRLVPGRSPDVIDWLADTAGACSAALWIHWRRPS